MSNILELSLTNIVNGIKKKDFTSEEVTKAFIENSKKSIKLNAYITECFDDAVWPDRKVAAPPATRSEFDETDYKKYTPAYK